MLVCSGGVNIKLCACLQKRRAKIENLRNEIARIKSKEGADGLSEGNDNVTHAAHRFQQVLTLLVCVCRPTAPHTENRGTYRATGRAGGGE